MAWVRIDDQLHSHPKFLAAWNREPNSVGLMLFSLSWAGAHLTDGAVSEQFVDSLFRGTVRRNRAVETLVDTGLWVPNGSGWEIHDYLDYNEPREIVLNRRRAKEAKKRANRKRLDADR